jgi:hypothetical protein
MSQLTTHGTEYFRDPEMVKLALEGREVREVNASKFDIYSIGAVLFFAIEGEFPTAGALSRFNNDVPLAIQWVANRAMAAMHQRYDNARQMLTDVDYLCYAAAHGALENIKPADLPSFRGMPVPPHLTPIQGIPVVNNSSYRQKLEALPGGYGQWYQAPHFKRKGEFGFKKAAAVVFMVGGLATVGVFTLGFLSEIKKEKERFDNEQRQQSADTLAKRVDPKRNDLKQVYAVMDRSFDRGVGVENHAAVTVRDADLPEAIIRDLDKIAAQWREQFAKDVAKNSTGQDANTARLLYAGAPVTLVSIDRDEADLEYAEGIEHRFVLEGALQKSITTTLSTNQRKEVREIFAGVSDTVALHREIGARMARDSVNPGFLAVFTVETVGGAQQVKVRMIYPGHEADFTYTVAAR